MIKRFRKFFTILHTPFYRQALLRYRVGAAVEHDTLLQMIGGELKTVVDIGANRGQFALAVRHHSPSARVISFEPLVEPAGIFRKVFQDDPGVELHPFAIGPQDGEGLMHVSRADDSSSLLPISNLQSQLFPGTEEQGTRRVIVKALDAVLDAARILRPALLKIDVQGYELEVLKGCASLLDCFDFLLIECSYMELYTGQALVDEVINYLYTTGFILADRNNLVQDVCGNSIQADFFFKRK